MTFSHIYCQAIFTAHIKWDLLWAGWKACWWSSSALREDLLGTAGSTFQTSGHRTGASDPLFITPYCEVHSKAMALCMNLDPKERGRMLVPGECSSLKKQVLSASTVHTQSVRKCRPRIVWVWGGSADTWTFNKNETDNIQHSSDFYGWMCLLWQIKSVELGQDFEHGLITIMWDAMTASWEGAPHYTEKTPTWYEMDSSAYFLHTVLSLKLGLSIHVPFQVCFHVYELTLKHSLFKIRKAIFKFPQWLRSEFLKLSK